MIVISFEPFLALTGCIKLLFSAKNSCRLVVRRLGRRNKGSARGTPEKRKKRRRPQSSPKSPAFPSSYRPPRTFPLLIHFSLLSGGWGRDAKLFLPLGTWLMIRSRTLTCILQLKGGRLLKTRQSCNLLVSLLRSIALSVLWARLEYIKSPLIQCGAFVIVFSNLIS